jgi:hypothetical protein
MAEPDDTAPLSALTGGPRRRRFRLAGWPLALVLVWVTLAVLDIVVIAPFGAASQSPASASGQGGGGHRQGSSNGQPSRRQHGHHQHGRHHHHAAPAPSPSATAAVLDPVSVAAFGPAGLSDGDNPSGAPEAIDASLATAWRSQWYATAEFGSLKTGTGLLVDMGRPVSITSVRILLDNSAGTDLKLYTGSTPVLADERVQASARDVGGEVHLALAQPERARYLVIWFTLLPPDSAGTFQEAVYNVQLRGTTGAAPGL